MKTQAIRAALAAIAMFGSWVAAEATDFRGHDFSTEAQALRQVREGRNTFRYATFGDETFWGDGIGLHQAIAGAANGGIGPGLSPTMALSLGLKVDVDALPRSLQRALARGKVDLKNPATTLELLKLDAVVGLTGIFDNRGKLTSMGMQCAFCHSTVDNSFAKGIGNRLDGWANRDLNVGAIIALAPRLEPVAQLLGTDVATVRTVLNSWGPGKYDAVLFVDGKAMRPDGKPAAVLIPPAFGLAGVNLHTSTGWGGISHWNAFVAVLEMHGQGTFYDPRLNDAAKYPVAQRNGLWNVRPEEDRVTALLPALQLYQLSLPVPRRRAAATTASPRRTARNCSTARPSAPSATCRRCTPSRAGTCTPAPRSASMSSRPAVRLTVAIEPRRCAGCGRTPRAASTTTDGSRPGSGDQSLRRAFLAGLSAGEKSELGEFLKSLVIGVNPSCQEMGADPISLLGVEVRSGKRFSMDVIDQRRRDLGGFEVGRVLPFTRRHMVGPFIFFDHIGPTTFAAGIPKSVDVRPHPHIGLATVTYLFAGEIMHRDSVGMQQPIQPNEVNWMIAGRGITHSERFEKARAEGGPMHGIQAWVALPNEHEEIAPSFGHFGAEALPVHEEDGARTRLLAGSAFGLSSGVTTHSPLFYAHWELAAGARVALPL